MSEDATQQAAYTPQLGAMVNYTNADLHVMPAIVAKVWPDGGADLFIVRAAWDGTMYLQHVPSSTISASGAFSPSTAGGSVSVNGTVMP